MRRMIAAPAALALLLLAIALTSCSKKSSPTQPGGGELSGSLPSTSSQYMHTFANAGNFNYECTIHPSCVSLHGVVVVVSAGTPILNRLLAISIDGGGSSSCSALSNTVDTVHVNDQVTWTNNSPLAHTVTSY